MFLKYKYIEYWNEDENDDNEDVYDDMWIMH